MCVVPKYIMHCDVTSMIFAYCSKRNIMNLINRGYYTAVRRYEFYLRVVKTIFYEGAQRVSKILFSPREDKIHIFKPRRVMFCLLYSCKQFKTQVSNINFRSIMQTWLYFNII